MHHKFRLRHLRLSSRLTHEVERLKDECGRSISGQCDLLDLSEQRQKAMERQLAGLTSFAKHDEKFLEQRLSGGAAAPFECSRLTGREREILNSGQLEIQPFHGIKKQSEFGILGAWVLKPQSRA